jgi:prepilin-type N-terminal cleavage/methylation domain-containing protein/prepilin-type processing-associated H-X9-DG protein
MSISKRAFTLVELLVVIATIAVLMSILVPALAAGRAQGKAAVCKSNLRQLVLANIGYANENNGSYVPAAIDITSSNLHRWHGARNDIDSPFDPANGPLAEYLADGCVKQCPENVNFRRGDPWNWDFEDGCGGYGYNMTYIGSRVWESYDEERCGITAKDSDIRHPSQTLMFADTAMAKLDNDIPYYLEYSFAEPPYFVVNGEPVTSWGYSSPSIHFRHRDRASIGWADGHTDSRRMAEFKVKNAYDVESSGVGLGWFGPIDNSLFDLK